MSRILKNNRRAFFALLAVSCLAFTLMAVAQEQAPAAGQNPPSMRCPMCGQMIGPNQGNKPMMQHQPGMMMGMGGQNVMPQGPGPGAVMGMGPGMGMMPHNPAMQGAGMGLGQGMGMRPQNRAMRGAGMGQGMEMGMRMMPRPGQPAQINPAGPDGLLRNPEVQKELGITVEQRQKLMDIGFESAKAGIQAKATLQILHLELDRLMNMENPDKTVLDKKLQEIAQAQTAEMRTAINARVDSQNVLTKDQRARLPQVIQKLRPQPAGQMMLKKPAAAPAPDKP
jgi:hypothetical protein